MMAASPKAVVMEHVGHDSAQMLAHYTHVGHEALKHCDGKSA